jgi:hypothetical protein
MTTQTLPSIPEPLQAIPEIVEAHEIMVSGSLPTIDHIVEVTIPTLSAEHRAFLQEYLRKVEENSYYVTDHLTDDEGEVIYIRAYPLELLASLCGERTN